MAEIIDIRQTPSLAGVSDVLSPTFTLRYLQKDITNDITPYVTRVSYTDNIKSESDEIEVELDDTDGRWLDKWYPGKGDTLTLRLGYLGEQLLNCGTFSIDEIEVSSPPSTVSIRGVATSINMALRTKSNRGFENTTLAAIASRIAKKHRLKLVGSIETIKIDRVTQYSETDIAFLKRLANEYGYAVKVVSEQLIFSHLTTLRSQVPIKKLFPHDVAQFSLRDTINKVYKKAKVKHQKAGDKKLIVYEADGTTSTSHQADSKGKNNSGKETSADTLKVNSRATDKNSAEIKAQSALDSHNEYQQNGSLSLMGSPQLTAGNKIELIGFGKLSGQWLITSARHSFDRSSGYVTELEIARGPITSGKSKKGKKSKTQKLVVYKPDGSSETVIKEKTK
ncbi:phage late control D family protein [Xenorhabdus thuongxuanensis]|uniref:Phage protein n=1 Tax=Xenorhabdus thuongxuanensis TaxID=1873484 RepID=A0A1Q5U4B8_9GAMM|nr:contractile injection system protein, VgrG/Pvc8 family [Xenorhabdus thuongxuanensis]OKP07317.1 phage protein [Xenorhabdus thuongxuanensis]